MTPEPTGAMDSSAGSASDPSGAFPANVLADHERKRHKPCRYGKAATPLELRTRL